MGERYLITASLLSSWAYQFSDFYGMYDSEEKAEQAEERAEKEFLSTLRRERTPTTEVQQRGIDFENLATLIAEGKGYDEAMALNPGQKDWERWYDGAYRIALKVQGGVFQSAFSAPLTIGDTEYLLYGRLDALKAGVIYDIKYSSRYEYGNFYESAQHSMYLAIVPEAHAFTYLVYRPDAGVFEETYRRENTPDIAQIITGFAYYLRTHDLTGLYREHWKAQ
jgi:hypothetical protein